MHFHGFLRKSMKIYKNPQKSTKIHGLPWRSMDIHGLPWVSMDIHGLPWVSMDLHGSPWICMDLHGYAWISMDMHGYPWISMEFLEFLEVHGHLSTQKSIENLRSRIDRKSKIQFFHPHPTSESFFLIQIPRASKPHSLELPRRESRSEINNHSTVEIRTRGRVAEVVMG